MAYLRGKKPLKLFTEGKWTQKIDPEDPLSPENCLLGIKVHKVQWRGYTSSICLDNDTSEPTDPKTKKSPFV